MSSQYYYSQNAPKPILSSNRGLQQQSVVYTTQPPSGTIPSHQSTSSGKISQQTTNIQVLPTHLFQPQIISQQQMIKPQNSSDVISPIYSSAATTMHSGQQLTKSQIFQNSTHPQCVQVSTQPIILSPAGNSYSLENGKHVTVQQNSHQPYYTNIHQGTVLQTHISYSQPTSVSHLPPQAHFHHSVPTTNTIKVVHTSPNHTIQQHHNRIIQAEQQTIYQYPPPARTLHFHGENGQYTSVEKTHKSSQPTMQVPLQFSPLKADEEKQYVTTFHQPSYVSNQQPNNIPLNQACRGISVYAVRRENSTQDNISPITPLSTNEEFNSQPTFSNSFQRIRLDDNKNVGNSFCPKPSTILRSSDMFSHQTSSKLKMALDSQSLMVEKDESAETMDFNYYSGATIDEYEPPTSGEGKRSCSECRRVHKRCSKERPCLRCVRLGKKCIDLPERKRGRPKKIDKIRHMNNTLSSTTPTSTSSVSSNGSTSILKMSIASIGSQSSVSSFGASPISTPSSLSESLGSSLNSQVSSVSSIGNHNSFSQQQYEQPPPKGNTVLPSFSNLIQELDIRGSLSRHNQQ